jgi:thioredoxin reductase (NADPH)
MSKKRSCAPRPGSFLRIRDRWTVVSQAKPSIIERRYDQMFPILERSEIDRVCRFGSVRSFAVDEAVVKAGDVGSGLTVILAGRVEALQRDSSGLEAPIVTQGPGAFLGEPAQLAGRPALVDAYAREPVKALIIPPERLRALIVAEAELGERIMRALILRRMGLLETGAGGPIIVGRADDGGVLRLASFLRSNSHPRRVLDPDTDFGGQGVDRALSRRSRRATDCSVPARTVAA